MFYLFEIAYKFRVRDSTADWYGISQVVAKELDDAKKALTDYRGYVGSILEFKLLKVTPISSAFVTYSTNISDTIYHQFECIEEGQAWQSLQTLTRRTNDFAKDQT
jgi:hypothetical protein